MNLSAYTRRDLQNGKAMLTQARAENQTIDALLALIERAVHVEPAPELPKQLPPTGNCPSCGRASMVPAKGVSEPVLVCPACRYSEYREEVAV